jgi:membrane AbrB-like protein
VKLPNNLTPKIVAKIMATIAFGAVGGFIADYLTLPLPWLIGALIITLIAALSGAPLQSPGRLRHYMITILGVMLGSGFSPEIFEQITQWPVSLAAVLLYTIGVTAIIIYCLTKFTKFGFVNSFFGGAPGGLAELVILAREYGGDERLVSLMHSTRLMLTVLTIPFFYRFYYDYTPAARAAGANIGNDIALLDFVILLGCAVLGYFGGKKIKLPAYQIFGPLVLSAFVHITGITDAHLPGSLIIAAQLVFGTALGCQFIGITLKDVSKTITASIMMTFVFIIMAAVFAYGLSEITGLPFRTLFLTFSPGGLPEMTLISLSLNIDIAFVTTHHSIRVIFLLAIVPVLFYWIAPHFGITLQNKDKI